MINVDALQFDYDRLSSEYPGYKIAVCSNLPYYITSELIMRFLECKIKVASITVLIQKEACNRLISAPGSPDYGAITASVSYYAKAEKLFLVGPGNFIPRPKVDSAVLRLIPHETPPVEPKDIGLFFSIIRSSFAARRKTLLNSLSGSMKNFTKEDVSLALQTSNIDPNRRGETLSLKEFSLLADSLFDIQTSRNVNK